MDGRLARAALVALVLATVLGWVSVLGRGYALTLLFGTAAATLMALAIWYGNRYGGDIAAWLRERMGSADGGTYHAFGGVQLHVDDDGRHIWIRGSGVQKVLGLKEHDLVTASRVPGMWQRDADDVLWLRVDALIQTLSRMPGRSEPRLQRFRRYLERDVLFPAQQRHRRG